MEIRIFLCKYLTKASFDDRNISREFVINVPYVFFDQYLIRKKEGRCILKQERTYYERDFREDFKD